MHGFLYVTHCHFASSNIPSASKQSTVTRFISQQLEMSICYVGPLIGPLWGIGVERGGGQEAKS